MSVVAVKHQPDSIATARPERDFVSWSQLSTFRQCPLRYHFRYDLRLPEEFASPSLLFGGGIHRAIEVLHRDQLEGNTPRLLDELMAEFWDEWKFRSADAPEIRFGKQESPQTFNDLARRVLCKFLESELSRPVGQVIAIEEELRGEILPGVKDLLAIVDLVIDRGDALILRDYKTARSRWSKDHADDSAEQLLLYSSLVGGLGPEKSLRLEFVVLTKAASPAIELYELSCDPHRVAKTKLIAERTVDAIAAGNIYPNPSPTNCGSCPYKKSCREWCG